MGGANLMHVIRARTLIPSHALPPISDAGIVIHDGLVVALGKFSQIRRSYVGPDVDVDGILIPGLVDAHSHLRGMPLTDHGIPSTRLEPWLCSLTTMTALPPADDSLVAAGNLLRTGVTTVQAMVHSFAPADELLETVAEVANSLTATGLRAVLAIGFADRAEFAPEPADARHSLLPRAIHRMPESEFARFVDSVEALLASDPNPLLAIGVGPVAAQWTSAAALDALARTAPGRRIHTHLNESPLQRDWLAGEGSPVDRLQQHGLLGSQTSAAHGVDLSSAELQLLAAAGVALVHCPTSNASLGVGDARVREWLDAGIPVALGMDSNDDGASDMFAEMRTALDVSARVGQPLTPAEVFAMATTGGAAAVGDSRLGRLVPGTAADIVELAVDQADEGGLEGVVANAGSASVRNVWVAGQPALRDGVVRTHAAENRARERMTATLHRDRADRERRQRELAPALEQAHALWEGHHGHP